MQESNWGLQNCRWILNQLSYKGSPRTSLGDHYFISHKYKQYLKTFIFSTMAETVLGDLYLIYLHKIATIRWIIEKAREFQKNIYFCFTDYSKAFDCVDHNKLWKILQGMKILDHLTCLLRNLHAGQEATVRIEHRTTDWFKLGKGMCQGCILSPY